MHLLYFLVLLSALPTNRAAITSDNPSIISSTADFLRRAFQRDNGPLLSEGTPPADSRQLQPQLRKMSDDEDEKFWPEYWGPMLTPLQVILDSSLSLDFNSSSDVQLSDTRDRVGPPDQPLDCLDMSTVREEISFAAPLALHRDSSSQCPDASPDHRPRGGRLFARQAPGFTCPAGSTSCAGIGRGTSCCRTGSACYIVTDTGLGDVGCCPPGNRCLGSIADCPNGFSTCNRNIGGGCCVPGYTCVANGCVPGNSVVSIFVQATSVTSSQSTTTVPTTTTASASALVPPFVNTVSEKTGQSTTTSSTSSSTTDSSSSSSSASSTPPSTSTVETSTSPPSATIAPLPPFRGTSGDFLSTETVTTSSISFGSICPTGFYACSAVYQGGCCRTGRDCATTNCPKTSTVQLVTFNGLTIGVPAGSAATTAAALGNCAKGWSTCPASASGGCCPSGYACGTVSCDPTIAAAGTVEVAKVAAGAERLAGFGIGHVVLLCVGMLFMVCI